MTTTIRTTVIGSYPVPEWLRALPNQVNLRDAAMVVMKAQELAGIDVVAMNVKRLGADQLDPSGYRKRLDAWSTRLAAARAASFKVVLDPEELASVLAER